MNVRRLLSGGVLAGLVLLSAAAGAWAASGVRKQIEVEYQDIKIAVDDRTVPMGDAEPFIYLEKGRTFVPARPLAEALGASVGWDAATSTVKVYSRSYATATRQGEHNLWSMPAHGFSIKAPVGFFRQELGFALLQLGPLDPTGTAPLVAVQRMAPDDRPASDKLAEVVLGLGLTFLKDVNVTQTAVADGKVSVMGSATYLGSVPSAFTVRLIPSAGGDFIIFALVPDDKAAAMATVVGDVIDSFTITQ